MARNPYNRETVHLKAVKDTKLDGERRRLDTFPHAESDPAAANTLSVPDLKRFIKIISDCRQLIKNAGLHIKLLAERNLSLQKEIIELGQKEAQTRHLAYHDGLTGLPNRNLLQDRFQQAMSQAKRHYQPLALLLLDLDEFKTVNDKLGHASGDKLLQEVAVRLTKGIRGADTACRYGGDEFVIMLPEIVSQNNAAALAAEIVECLGEPYLIDSHRIHLTVSVGVAVYPGDGQTLDELMKQADIAMYRSKGTELSVAVTAQPKGVVGDAEVYTLPVAKHADPARKGGLFLQEESVRARDNRKKQE